MSKLNGFWTVDLCVLGHVFVELQRSGYPIHTQLKHDVETICLYELVCMKQLKFLLCQQPSMLAKCCLMHLFCLCTYTCTHVCDLLCTYLEASSYVRMHCIWMDVTESSPECTVLPPLAGCNPINR